MEGWRAAPGSVPDVREGVAGGRPGLSGYSDHNFCTSRGTVVDGRPLPLFCARAGVAQSERSTAHASTLREAKWAWPQAADITESDRRIPRFDRLKHLLYSRESLLRKLWQGDNRAAKADI
jgi:hypothetical protein